MFDSIIKKGKKLIRRSQGFTLDEFKVRAGQLLHSWTDRFYVKIPKIEKDGLRIQGRFLEELSGSHPSVVDEKFDSLKKHADAILSGKIDIFESEVKFVHKLPWHRDFINGFESTLNYCNAIPYLDAALIGDSKVIWELNRLQFLLPVAKAFAGAKKAEYLNYIRKTLLDWVQTNPYPRGINWCSSLELTFRIVVLDWIVRFCGRKIFEDQNFSRIFLKNLIIHGRHINCYLSTYFSPNTHLTGEALGLYLLGSRYPFLPEGRKWRRQGRKILLDCLDWHVLPDGGYFERSFWYHRYTLEIYLLFAFLAEECGDRLPGEVKQKISLLCDFLIQAVSADGFFPLIGDDDGGRLIALDDLSPGDARGLFALCAVYLNRGDLKHLAGDNTEAIMWMYGQQGIDKYLAIETIKPANSGCLFRETGYAFLRDGWEADSVVISTDAGPHGYGNCGHAHSDALSLTMSIGYHQIIVDPGTYTYTYDLEKRNLLRSIEAHSTLFIEGQPVNVPSESPFHWARTSDSSFFAKNEHIGWKIDFLEACNKSYADFEIDFLHNRRLLFIKPKKMLLIWDFLIGTGEFPITNQYILGGNAWKLQDNSARSVFGSKLKVGINVCCSGSLESKLEPFEISPGYLQLMDGSRLRYRSTCTLPAWMVNVMTWGEADRELEIEAVSSDLLRIKEENETLWCSLAGESEGGSNAPILTDARAACIITQNETVRAAWALDVSKLSCFSNQLVDFGKKVSNWEFI